jgi:N-acetylglucosaminyldiphosphoundecaprenol N-acetyl-beta-D-mannosaminyltransferase
MMILGARIDATSYAAATEQILAWAAAGESRVVCAANVHTVMEAQDTPAFRRLINGADLNTPDGVPLVWALRALGVKHQTRVYGPDLTLAVCAAAAEHGTPVGFFGGTPAVLEKLLENFRQQFPKLRMVYTWSPPFRALTPAEDETAVAAITASGARILLVGLGCPKQERWMMEHRGRVPAVMLGVGAAFDFHAGNVRQAPRWMMRLGLEWLFRLVMEPRRLWRRYLKHNPRFVWLFARQLLRRGDD